MSVEVSFDLGPGPSLGLFRRKDGIFADVEATGDVNLFADQVVFQGAKGVADLARLKRVPGRAVTEVRLNETEVTDEGLSAIAHMTGVEILVLDDLRIADAGIKHLVGLSRLKILSIEGTNVTDQGLQLLRHLTDLTKIDAYRSQVTRRGADDFEAEGLGAGCLQKVPIDWLRSPHGGLGSMQSRLADWLMPLLSWKNLASTFTQLRVVEGEPARNFWKLGPT